MATKIPLLTALILAPLAHAEPALSRLEGVVLDPARAPLGGARISALLESRSLGLATVTGPDGRFALQLESGRYQLQIFSDGFRSETRQIDMLHTVGAYSIEIVLQLGERREIVTVTDTVPYQAVAAAAIKAPVLLLDTPQAISVVSGRQVRDQAMQNMADVVRYIPGITMGQGEGHRDAPVIRGNITTSDFYVDGVRDDVQYLRDLYNVERVEAVKGANALTFGRGGGGGVLNRVTKAASLFPIREIVVQGGSFAARRITADVGHSYKDKVGMRVNAMYENSSSFRNDVHLERYGVSPSLMYQVTERTQVRLRYEYYRNGLTIDRGVPSVAGRPVVVHRSTFFGDPSANDSRAEVNLGSAAIEHQRGIWNFRNTVLAGDYGKFYQNVVPGAVNAAGTLVTFSGYNDENARRNLFNQTDVTATHYTGAIRHVLLMGTEFGRQRAWNLRNTALFPNGSSTIQVPLLSPNVNLHASFAQRTVDNRPAARVAAAFVQDQIELSRYVQLVAGLRYDNFASEVADRRSAATFQRTDNLISPRLGLVLKPAAEISLYGSYSVSYLPSSGDQFSSLNPTTQALKPEKFNNYEGGLKWDINRNLSLTSALYRLDRLNTTAPDPNIAGRLVQTGSQRTNGFETSLSGMVTDRWTIAGGYSWQDAFISSRTTAALPGKKVAIVPRHNLSLWNSVRLLTRLSAGLGLIRQGEMFAGIDNAVTLPAFTRVDAALFYNLTERVRLQANAENLTNRNYYPTAHNNSNIMPGSPLAIRVGLVVGF